MLMHNTSVSDVRTSRRPYNTRVIIIDLRIRTHRRSNAKQSKARGNLFQTHDIE